MQQVLKMWIKHSSHVSKTLWHHTICQKKSYQKKAKKCRNFLILKKKQDWWRKFSQNPCFFDSFDFWSRQMTPRGLKTCSKFPKCKWNIHLKFSKSISIKKFDFEDNLKKMKNFFFWKIKIFFQFFFRKTKKNLKLNYSWKNFVCFPRSEFYSFGTQNFFSESA